MISEELREDESRCILSLICSRMQIGQARAILLSQNISEVSCKWHILWIFVVVFWEDTPPTKKVLTRWYFVVFEEDAHPQQSLSCGQGGDEGYLWSSLYFLLSDQNTALNSETKPCLRIFRIATQEGQTRWERQGWPFENFDCRPEPWWCRKAKVWPVHL